MSRATFFPPDSQETVVLIDAQDVPTIIEALRLGLDDMLDRATPVEREAVRSLARALAEGPS